MSVVGHLVPHYLPISQTFVYQVLTHHVRYRPVVAAHHRVADARHFPLDDVWTHGELDRRTSLDAWYRRWRWYVGRAPRTPIEGLFERKGATVLHSHFGHVGAGATGHARRLGLPHVTAFYGYDDTVLLADPERRAGFDRLFAEADAILVEGSHIASRLEQQGCPAETLRIQRIGIDVTRIAPEPPSPREGAAVRVLVCGRLVDKKGIDDALRAVGTLTRAGRRLELRVVGDGPLRPALEQLATDLGLDPQAIFLGSRPYAAYLAEIARCDLVVVPSRTARDGETEGGAPTVLIEAQAAAKPILTTRHADIPEIVVPGESALVVPEADPDALTEALASLLDDPESWAARGLAGRRHVECHHDARRQNEKLEALYDELRQRKGA